MGGSFVILVSIVVLFLFIILMWMAKRYRRCPSDKILVVYGKIGEGKEGARSAKCIHGGAAFIWPVIQDYEYLDLTPIPINVDLRNALSKQNIRVSVPSRFMVGISPEPGIMENAAERLLGQSLQQIHDLAADIIFGQLRVVIATMIIEEINTDREKFLINVSDSVEHELKKIGLKLINVNITDITDEAGYIEALGKEATAKAVNEAKKVVAEKNRDGAIGEANANMDQRIKVSEANSSAMVGEANAHQKQRTEVSKANALAVEGENLAKITVANSDATRREKEAEAQRKAIAAEKVSEAKALEEAYTAQQLAEVSRAERDKATQTANIIVPAEIDKKKVEIAAEAEAERIRRIAKGEADALFMTMEAQGKGVFEVLSKQAEGFKKIVEAAGNQAKDAVLLMVADKLPELVGKQVEAIKNIKIDKVTVWDSGNSANGKNATANFLSGMAGSIPPLEDLFNMAGMQLPEYLRSKNKQITEIAPEEKKELNK
jgi:flotillin